MADDYSANRQTAGVVAVGGSVTGEIETSGDQDWFAVELEAGVEYQIDLEGSATGGGTLEDPWLRWLHDADRVGIRGTRDLDGGEGLNARQVFTPQTSGVYYISANGAQGQTGGYTLSVTRLTPQPAADDLGDAAPGGTTETPPDLEEPDDGGPDEVTEDVTPPDPPIAPEPALSAADLPADTTTTGVVSVGGSVTGEIETVGDRDWFAVELEAGSEYRIDLKGGVTGDGTLGNPMLDGIYDAAGVRISGSGNNDSGEGLNAQVRFTATESGVHYVAAQSANQDTGSYTLSVTRTGRAPEEVDHAAGPETTGTVAVDGSVKAAIETVGDRDWFAVELEAGVEYRVDLKGGSTDDGTLVDPVLHGVRTATGADVPGTFDDDDGEGRNAQARFTATESGVHYIMAGSNQDTGSYTVSVTRMSPPADDDPGDDAGGTTEPLSGPGDSADPDDGRPDEVTEDGPASGSPIEPEPELSVADAEAREGEDAVLRFRVTLDRAAAGPVTVGYATVDGTAVAGEDYESASGTLTFAAGETELTVEVTVLDDTVEDSGETFTLRLSEPSGAALADAEAIGTIVNTEASVSEPTGQDLPADTTTTGRVAVGDSATGEIGKPLDHDWFAVSLERGHIYQVALTGRLDTVLVGIYDSQGAYIEDTYDDDSGPGFTSRVTFVPQADGTYYVAARAFLRRTGDYEVSVTDVTNVMDDYTADTSTTGTVTVGSSVTGTIDPWDDRDWFAVELVAGKTYRFDLKGADSGSGTLAEPYLRGIYDAGGNLIDGTSNDDGGSDDDSRMTFTPGSSATYYVSAGGFLSYTGTYTLAVTDVSDDYPSEIASHVDTTGTVAVKSSVTGTIDFEFDRDWFAVTLEAGKIYRFDLEGDDTNAGTLDDPKLHGIYDASGTLVDGTARRHGGQGDNARVAFVPDTGGTYYVSVGGGVYYNMSGGHTYTGTYKLSVSEISDEFTADTSTTGTVVVGGSATGELQFTGDRDWFKVTLEANETYRIDLRAAWDGGGTLLDPYLHGIYNSEGTLIGNTTDDNSGVGASARVYFTAAADGAYYVAVGGGAPRWWGGEGTYTLSVTEVVDDYAADTGTTGAVTVDGSATGEIEYADDHDWFAVALEAGYTYQVDLEGIFAGYSLHSPYLRGIYDAAGTLLPGTQNDRLSPTTTSSRVIFTASEDATYYVSAGAVWPYLGTYELSVTEISDGM